MYRLVVKDAKFPKNDFCDQGDMYSLLRRLEDIYEKEYIVEHFDSLIHGREVVSVFGKDHQVTILISHEG